ncbi:MAG: transcription antitermination factor NusB [Nitrospirae bacterium]|nr:transcription antitermination factor NusB [Nitrospirota bacterium]
MTRRQAREFILQVLFEFEFTGTTRGGTDRASELSQRGASVETIAFVEDIIGGTIRHLKEIDEIIQSASKHWEFDRIAAVDRNIMRFAVYELRYRTDIPAAVTINEAVDIAKKFSTIESYSFINGVLDRIAHGRP